MKPLKLFLALVTVALATACNAPSDDGAKFVGNWHTAPMTQNVTKQEFRDIRHEGGDKYSVTGYWVAMGSTSGKTITAFTLKDGALSGPLNTTLILNDKGALIADGMEFTK